MSLIANEINNQGQVMDKDNTEVFRLSEIEEGRSCTLVKWDGLQPEDRLRLKERGVMLGMPVKVCGKTFSGPVVLAVNDTHVAIAHELAAHILVLVQDA
jgi:Fe2+ transport system protein FeoA